MPFNTTTIWIVFGSLLCGAEFVLPTAYVSFLMGVSALGVAVLSLLGLPFWLQLLTWIISSALLVFWVPRFLPRFRGERIREAMEAQTLTEIKAGRTGRVLYEGNSWQARCEDPDLSIAADQRVYVVRREGTTLIVLPVHLLQP